MSSSSSEVRNILDLPDEVLVEIVLHLTARERLTLADSCKRLNSLVFGYRALLRDLDFSKKGVLTTAAHIQRYFSREATRQYAIKVNVENVYCMNAGYMLSNSIGRAINLVDINIHGTKFEDVEMLGRFLAPLLHLKRLSLDWPQSRNADLNSSDRVLQKPFRRLTYLSLVICIHHRVLPPVVKLCLELEELRMLMLPYRSFHLNSSSSGPIKLKNLKVIQFSGGDPISLKDDLMAMVPDPAEWTDFHLIDSLSEGYLERNVELCDELSNVKLLSRPLSNLNVDGTYHHKMGWNLLSDRLLEKVITITHEDVPEKFCCLNGNRHGQSCLLKIEEAKKLLKDPEYQVSYLQFNHTIEHDCDAHLVAAAFPNVTELVFHCIGSPSSTARRQNRKMRFKRRLRKKGSIAPEEEDDTTNPESSFKMLIENTPHVKSLTINSRFSQEREWFDLDALYSIPRWKNLRVIIFMEIPMENGNFLIHIGKECQELTEVQLMFPLNFPYKYCYGSGLVQMLNHSRYLRKFSIEQRDIDNMSEMFEALSNNPKIETVRVRTDTKKYDCLKLISSIEQMLHRCPDLTEFAITVSSELNGFDAYLTFDLQRIVGELNRPNLVFLGPNHELHPKIITETPQSSSPIRRGDPSSLSMTC